MGDADFSVSQHHRRRRWLAAGGVAAVAVIGGGIAAAATGTFDSTTVAGTTSVTPPALAAVTQGSLSSETEVGGTLSYSGNYTVTNLAHGFYTWLPAQGQVIKQGNALYKVSGEPVVLLYGSVPFYRNLSEGMSGDDVRQLNADLVAMGYASKSDLDPTSDYFGAETATAVEALQSHLGVTQSGTLAMGQAVFLPTEARITTVRGSVGSPAGSGVPILAATSTIRQITVNLPATEQSYVAAGDKVTITLANGKATTGVVTSVGTVATAGSGSSSTPTVTVHVTLEHPSDAGNLDAEPVQVAITTATVGRALAVPVTALLATASGGYEVQVAEPRGHYRIVQVSLGLFDDAAGLVQVTANGLQAGDKVWEGQG
jgi:peptidoglycan hydrolase-like protein with peptidoglycan-binding domain